MTRLLFRKDRESSRARQSERERERERDVSLYSLHYVSRHYKARRIADSETDRAREREMIRDKTPKWDV
jgi:hypothetical protein